MRLLFIKPKHIGDSLILTPTLTAAKEAYPEAEIWVLVRAGCDGILAGCPVIDHILTLAQVDQRERPKSRWREDWNTLLKLREVSFDDVFELGDGHRGRWFAMLCRHQRAFSVRPATSLNVLSRPLFTAVSTLDWSRMHRVEKDYRTVSEFLPLPERIPPLSFEWSRTAAWPAADGLGDFAVLHLSTRQKWNKWNRDGWLRAAQHLLGRTEHLIVSSGPDPRDIADSLWLREKLGDRVLCTLGDASWAQLAALLYRARLLLCPSTAALHLAAACQCPVVGIFGPTVESHWHPWESHYHIVTSDPWRHAMHDPYDEAAVQTRRMEDIEVNDVLAACDEMLRPAPHWMGEPHTVSKMAA